MSIQVLTDKGRMFTGYRVKETDYELHLMDTSTRSIRRTANDSINVPRDKLCDLVRFLTMLGAKPGEQPKRK